MTIDQRNAAVPASRLSDGLDGATACLFCEAETKIKAGCTKKRWRVCDDHFMVECPECGHEAFWMQDMKSGRYYACFSLSCNWRSTVPPNVADNRTPRAEGSGNDGPLLGGPR